MKNAPKVSFICSKAECEVTLIRQMCLFVSFSDISKMTTVFTM